MLIFSAAIAARPAPRKFSTDYCTAYPEGPGDAWKHCCLVHDMYFWAGGSRTERGRADLELKECVKESGHPVQARLIYWVVRAGGFSPYRLPKKKWNNGWPGRPDYQALTAEDIDAIEDELLKEGYEFIPALIKDDFMYQLRSRLD